MPESRPEGTITILFTDVEGSTDLRTRLGDEEAQPILRAHEDLVHRQIEEHGGRSVKALGDGVMAAFPSARRAVTCAVGIQKALETDDSGDGQVRVRVGLNAGEVVEEEGDLFGAAVNAAARIAAKARGGQILVARVVKDLAGPDPELSFLDRGLFWLKGFPERWRLFEVAWEARHAPLAPATVGQTPLVGREEERADLRRFVEDAAAGRGSLVLIGGEPGVGKTRIAEEVLAEAEDRGMLSATGRCREVEMAPYGALVDVLEGASRTLTAEAFRDALGTGAGEIARLMPEIRRRFDDVPPPLDLPPQQERRLLLNSLREFLERTAHDRPLAVLVDDLHWADEGTLLALRQIVDRLESLPLLVLATYRDVEMEQAVELRSAMEPLVRARATRRLSLKRLPQTAVEEMLRALAGQDPPAPLVDVVFSETEGNPYFVEEVFRHLSDEGELFDERGRFRAELRVDELDVPDSVRLLIERRLERVGETTRRVLAAAAVVGRDFTYGLLEALGEESEDALLDGLDEAERSRLIASSPNAHEERFVFTHELVRQTLLGTLTSARRRRLHLRAAEAIEKAAPDRIEEHAAEIARHLTSAGSAADRERTGRYLILAGKRALESSAFEDALRHLEPALALIPDDDRRARAELLDQLGTAQQGLRRWEEALVSWNEALGIYESLGEAETVGRMSWVIAFQLAWAGRQEETVEIIGRGLQALEGRENVDYARLLLLTAVGFADVGYHDAAWQMLDKVERLADELGADELRRDLLHGRCVMHWSYLELDRAIEEGRKAAELMRSEDAVWDLASALSFVMFALFLRGKVEEAAEVERELEPIAHRLGQVGALLYLSNARGWSELTASGDLDAFERRAREGLEIAREAGVDWGQAITLCNLALVEFWRANPNAALERSAEAFAFEAPPAYRGWHVGGRFLCAANLGERAQADEAWAELRTHLPEAGKPNMLGNWEALVATIEGRVALGEVDEAATLYPLVLEYLETGVVWCLTNGRILHSVAGIAAAAGKRWEEAEEHFRTALRQADELPSVLERPETRRFYARMLLDRNEAGDVERARDLLTEALEDYRKIGMPWHAAKTEALLKEA